MTPLVTEIPGGNAPDAITGCSSGIPLAIGPPADKADSEGVTEGMVWYGNECLVIEEAPD